MCKLLLFASLSLLCGCAKMMNAYPENFLEESIESAIESASGLDIDLTDDSPEVK